MTLFQQEDMLSSSLKYYTCQIMSKKVVCLTSRNVSAKTSETGGDLCQPRRTQTPRYIIPHYHGHRQPASLGAVHRAIPWLALIIT